MHSALNPRSITPRVLAGTLLILPIVVAALCLSAEPTPELQLHRHGRQLMGTYCEIRIYDSDLARAESAATAALDEMERVDRMLSNWDPATELSAMNREASSGPYHASEELYAFVQRSRRFHDATRGAFDPTVGPIVRAWGFLTPEPSEPDGSQIAAAKARSGFDKVELNESERAVQYLVPGVEFDPGGIGKGYAVDKAVEVLAGHEIEAALVSAGGSTLYGIGHPPGRDGWRIAIDDPVDWRAPLALVELRDRAVSTSGALERFVTIGERRYSHIIDPRTGDPIENMCQVTVLAPSATESEAWTKAAFILSRESLTESLQHRADLHVYRDEGSCAADSPAWVTPWSSEEFAQPAQ